MKAGHKFNSVEYLLEELIENQTLAGAGMIVTSKGQIAFESYRGLADKETGKPVTADSIFRIHSMTKVVTAVLTMIMQEKGKLKIDDPVSKYLPGFKASKVYDVDENGKEIIRSVKTPVTIRHLMSMTSGIPYEHEDVETKSGREAAKLIRYVLDEQPAAEGSNLVYFANRLGQIPLCFDPGEHWMYGFSADVLGAILEVAGGLDIGELMKKEIFLPLQMEDTGFWVPETKIDRLADLNRVLEDGNWISKAEDVIERPVDHKPVLEYGGGGLFCTCRDYAKFTAMLAAGGEYQGKRLLQKKSVEEMRTPQLGVQAERDYKKNRLFHCKGVFHKGYTYGLGVRTLQDAEAEGGRISKNEFGWDGVYGTWCSIDMEKELSVVIMTQRFPFGHHLFVPYLMNEVYRCME